MTASQELILQTTKDIISDFAPEESALVEQFFNNSQKDAHSLHKRSEPADEPLGFGVSEFIQPLTPVVIVFATETVAWILENTRSGVGKYLEAEAEEIIRTLLSRKKHKRVTFSDEQLKQVRKQVVYTCSKFQVSPERSEELADALIGRLILKK